jgi:hypothetical protein
LEVATLTAGGLIYTAGGSASLAGAAAGLGTAAVGVGSYYLTSKAIEGTWIGEGGIGDWVYDVVHPEEDEISNVCEFSSRDKWQDNKPGRKKQGREPGEKKRQKPGWQPRNPPKEPPRHTPSRKN